MHDTAAPPLDRRTRRPDDAGAVDAATFHAATVPDLLDRHGEVASRALRASGLGAITIGVDGTAWTWRQGPTGELEVVEGDDGSGPRADLPADWFADMVDDVRSAMGVMMTGRQVMVRGAIGHLVAWDLVLRALVDGRPAYEPGLVEMVDRDGSPLDPARSFRLDDDPEDLRHHLTQAGFLHLRGVVSAAEVAQLDSEVTRWLDALEPEDPRSWFARVGDDRVCVRATGLDPADVGFPHAERLSPVAELLGAGHGYVSTDLLRKPVGVVEGLSDLPWHRDCDPGLHSYRCTSLTVGVSVTPSGRGNGELGVIAGSHRANMTLFDLVRVDLPRVHLTTDSGDVTVHLSCALHTATPPTAAERRVTYSSFRLPGDTEDLDRTFRDARDAAGRRTYAPT